MNDDLRALLRDSDGGPVADADPAAVMTRARAIRVTRVVVLVLVAVLGGGAALAVTAGLGDRSSQVFFSDADDPSGREAEGAAHRWRVDDGQVLAVAAADDPPANGRIAHDADQLAAAWEEVDATTDPPPFPDDSAVLVVGMRSGTCRAAEDVIGVEVAGATAVVLLDLDGEFAQPCPGPEDAPRWSVFAVGVPTEVAEPLTAACARTLRTAGAEGGVSQDRTRELNAHLHGLIERVGFCPLGGDHDWNSASQVVEAGSGAWVSVFLYPEGTTEGDAPFEGATVEHVGDVTVELGQRSTGQPAARFDCGDYQFRLFADDDEEAVHQMAVALATQATCPYEPDAPAPDG